MSDGPDITQFLARVARGDAKAVDALIPHIYAALHRLAHRQRAHEAEHTLQTTALVHEAYLTLVKSHGLQFADRAHFFAYIARVMRHLLIDRVRRNSAQKRQMPERTGPAGPEDPVDVLMVDEALQRLAREDARLARVAELRLFAGLAAPEIAEVLNVTSRTVERDWLKARAFLSGCLLPPA
ncbi:MAG TPA: ECF-type sigma factor [Rudaea sp.]